MPEAEVSLRLAFFLIAKGHATSDIEVAIDGAQIQLKDKVYFPIWDFMREQGWLKVEEDSRWQGTYRHPAHSTKISVHSHSGKGDVVASLASGKKLRAETKKGPLERSHSSQEYPLIREALGQLLTVEEVSEHDILAVVVPSSPKFEDLAKKWRKLPLISRFDIRIATVNRDNEVRGLFQK